ncbi:MAG: hypothetical protein HYX78_04235 [Armatimonadetes bacterium]|nr:hypothetical protein [Armatimonadota bacterium]
MVITTSITSKERVKLAVSHVEPDRAPIHFYAVPEIRFAIEDYFGTREIEDILQVDFRYVSPAGGPVPRSPEPGSGIDKYDEWGTGYTLVPNNTGGAYYESTELPLARITSMDEALAYPWPDPNDFDYSVIPEQIERVRDYAVCVGSPRVPDIINGMGRSRGMDQVLIDIITEDEVGIALIDARVNYYYEWCKRCLEVGSGKIDILQIGEDLGNQNGPTISPACFESFFRPRLQKFFDLAHNYDAIVMLHSCGSTRLLQPQLIEMGLDILDSVQPEPVGMNPTELKAEFGDRLTYCGLMSVQSTLPHGTEEQCRAEARHRLDFIARGGGYIFAPAHNIQADTRIENILAIYEEATGLKFK